MSAFVGLLHLDGELCAHSTVQAMLGRLRHRVDERGANAAWVRADGPIGLGQMTLCSTPESLGEIERPDESLTLARDGLNLKIVAHARLDGRAALVDELKLGSQAQAWSDGRLILHAYARWGEECPRHLRGDWAFALWDEAKKQLFCARDRFGTRPFYYAFSPGEFFACANEIKALWGVPGLDSSVDDLQIAHYLLARFDDKTSTFYRHVKRLPPASWMVISAQTREIRSQLYWEFDGEREISLPSDEDYAQMLREGFVDSVRERMRCNGRFAVFLSGGLDSSSIAAVAAREAAPDQKPLTTFSTIFERFPECDESRWIDQTLARGEFAPMKMVGDEISGLADMERLVWHLDQPSPGPNSCSAWAQYALLQRAGFHVVLDGHGGDEVVWMGYDRVGELLRAGHFLTAWRELRLLQQQQIFPASSTTVIVQGLMFRLRSKRGVGRLIGAWRRAQHRRGQTRSRVEVGASEDLGVLSRGLLRPEFLERVGDAAPHPTRSVREAHAETLNEPLQPLALEMLDAMAGAHAIESRCPFWEEQLAQTCLAFPSNQKLRDGFNRWVMRRAMNDLLAPEVGWRRDKTNFAPQMRESLLTLERARIDALLDAWERDAQSVGRFVDLERVRAQWLELQNAPPESNHAANLTVVVWRVLALGIWLQQQPPREESTEIFLRNDKV